MLQQTGPRRSPWQERVLAGALERCSCSTRSTSLAGLAGAARSDAASPRTASRLPSASRPTAG
eukprot:9271485-Alexandrium_andersonii.AAC.1